MLRQLKKNRLKSEGLLVLLPHGTDMEALLSISLKGVQSRK